MKEAARDIIFKGFRDKPVIAVIGAGQCDEHTASLAYDVGHGIAEKGALLVCGGLSGCMENAAMGAKDAGGTTIGIIPTYDKSSANSFIDIVIATGLGHARNTLVVSTADAVIAVGGSYGTLSEIAVSRKLGKPVVCLKSWEFADEWSDDAGIFRAATAE